MLYAYPRKALAPVEPLNLSGVRGFFYAYEVLRTTIHHARIKTKHGECKCFTAHAEATNVAHMRFPHMTTFELLVAIETSTRELEAMETRRRDLVLEAVDREPPVPISQVAAAAQVTRPTIYEWMREGGSKRPIKKR